MSNRQGRYNRGGGGGQWQKRQGGRSGDSPRRGSGGVMSMGDVSIPSLLTLDVASQNRLQQRQMGLGSSLSGGLGAGLLGNAPNEFDSLSSMNRQSLLGPGPLSANSSGMSGMGFDSGLGSLGMNQGAGDGRGRLNDFDTYGSGMQSMGGMGNYGNRQGNLGQMGGVDETLAAKVRLQQAMLAAQAVQSQSNLGNFNLGSMGGGYQSTGGGMRNTQNLRRDFDNRRRDTGQRGGQLMNRRGGNLQQTYNRIRDNRNQDRNRNQQNQQQRNKDRNRQMQNRRDDSNRGRQQKQQQQRRQDKSKSKEREKRDVKEHEKREPKKEQETKKHVAKKEDASKSTDDEVKGTSDDKDTEAPAEDAGDEMYDPSEPTEEVVEMKDDEESGVDGKKRKRTESTDESKNLDDITVTIKQDDEGRAVAEPPRKKAALSTENQEEKKSSGTEGEPKPDWYCHVCQARCINLKNYENHMKGNRHRQKMEEIKRVAEFQTKQAKARLQAEKHIKNVLGDTDRKYCDDCKDYFRGSIIEHRQTATHKSAKKEGRPHCRVCNVTFKTPKKFVAHCNTPGHKKVYDLARKQAEEEARKSGKEFKEDEEGFLPPNLEDFVTVDAVGFEDDSDSDDDSTLSSSQISATGTPKGDKHSRADGSKSESVIAKGKKAESTVSDKVQPGDATAAEGSVSQAIGSSKTADHEFLPPVTSTHKPTGTSSSAGTAVAEKPQPAEEQLDTASTGEVDHDFDIGPYNPDIAFGQNHVVPVAGFFCKLCHKFYNNETNAKITHCKTKGHYMAVKKYLSKKKEESSKKITESPAAEEVSPSVSAKKEEITTTPNKDDVTKNEKEKTAAVKTDSAEPAMEMMETDQTVSDKKGDETPQDKKLEVKCEEPEVKLAETEQGRAEDKTAEETAKKSGDKEEVKTGGTAGQDVSEVKGEEPEVKLAETEQGRAEDITAEDTAKKSGDKEEVKTGGTAGQDVAEVKVDSEGNSSTNVKGQAQNDGKVEEKEEDDQDDISNLLSDIDDALGASQSQSVTEPESDVAMEAGKEETEKIGDGGEESKDSMENGEEEDLSGEKAGRDDSDEKMETEDDTKDDGDDPMKDETEKEVVKRSPAPQKARRGRGGGRGGRGRKTKK